MLCAAAASALVWRIARVVRRDGGRRGGNSQGGAGPKREVWESWKSKLGGLPARFIEALEVHGPMTRTQLRIAVGYASSRVADTIYKLNCAGLIDKANGISLKEMQ